MKTILLLMMIFVLSGCSADTVSSEKDVIVSDTEVVNVDNTEKQAVLDTYKRFQQTMIDKDMDTLEAIIKDDTIFTHMSGKQQTKAEYLEEIRNGTLNYFKSVVHDPEITVDGETAKLSAVTTLTAKVYGISGSWDLNTNAYFEKINGEWIYCNAPEDK